MIFKSVKMWLFRDSQLNSNGKLQLQRRHRIYENRAESNEITPPEKQHNGSSARLGVRERVERRVGVRVFSLSSSSSSRSSSNSTLSTSSTSSSRRSRSNQNSTDRVTFGPFLEP